MNSTILTIQKKYIHHGSHFFVPTFVEDKQIHREFQFFESCTCELVDKLHYDRYGIESDDCTYVDSTPDSCDVVIYNNLSVRKCSFLDMFISPLSDSVPKLLYQPFTTSKVYKNLDVHLLQLCPRFHESKSKFVGNYSTFDMNIECTYECFAGRNQPRQKSLYIMLVANNKTKIY
jgi:hypothetical protein